MLGCSLIDRNLARKYGLNNEMLRSVMDMPHSQAQSMEQVRRRFVNACILKLVSHSWAMSHAPLRDTAPCIIAATTLLV